MSKPSDNSQFIESWKNELDNKNFEELVRIVAFQEKYNPEFVKMAKSKLEATKLYNEEDVKKQIEELQREPQPKPKDPANLISKIVKIGCVGSFAITTLTFVIVVIATGGDSSAMNNGMKGAVAVIIWGIGIALYKLGNHFWKKGRKRPKA